MTVRPTTVSSFPIRFAGSLNLLGFDHSQFTDRFQGRDFRLTDVPGSVVTKLLA